MPYKELDVPEIERIGRESFLATRSDEMAATYDASSDLMKRMYHYISGRITLGYLTSPDFFLSPGQHAALVDEAIRDWMAMHPEMQENPDPPANSQ